MRAARVVLGLLAALVFCGLGAQPPAAGTFAAVDVYIDSAEPLAAWQFELEERRGAMQVVGIEGGGLPGYGAPPHYDRAAVERGAADRIIVADYSLSPAAALPVGRARVATVHVRLANAAPPDYELRLIAAGSADGRPIDANISIETRTGR
jgi:hypothetical protein